jgi:tetratricopeptide (TPR) repeat protein
MNRLELLHQFLKEDPNDPFNLYALALEYLKSDTNRSYELFTELLTHHSDYIPTYYHLGKLYQESGKKEEAVRTFETGIGKARQLKDHKALRELQSALQELRDEDLL